MADKQNKRKVRATIDCTHSGLVNGNLFMYLPQGMKNGQDSFLKPYPKPVTSGHPLPWDSEDSSPTIGRIIESEYVSYDILPDLDNLSPRADNIVDIVQEAYKKQCKDTEFKGAGHLTVVAEVSDEDAIDEVLDKRKLTVSIGAFVDNVRCSVCGSQFGNCEHELGQTYDGKKTFRVGRKYDV